jgi:hypothetical protein
VPGYNNTRPEYVARFAFPRPHLAIPMLTPVR